MYYSRLFSVACSAAVCLTMLVAGAGCGKNGIRVSGAVTHNGQPLESGSVSFNPANGVGPSQSAAIENGKFLLGPERGVTAGPKTVRIEGYVKTGKQLKAGSPSPPGTMIDEVVVLSMEGDPVEVASSGANEFNFVLDPKKAKRDR